MNAYSMAEPSLGASMGRLPTGHVKRDELVSTMLQDRNALRIIAAPHGFGKTRLAREYAARLFPDDAVAWIDATSPDFLLALDGSPEDVFAQCEDSTRLFILDGLPWLHEERAQALSERIDAVLYAGKEVIVTVTPSRDCLGAMHPDRLLICADDLLVSEQECVPRQLEEQDGDSRAFAKKRWRDAGSMLFGRTPLAMWGLSANAQQECLDGMFSEKLPLDILRAMFSMLLFQRGSAKEIEGVGVPLHHEDMTLLMRDYPVFGIDPVSGEYEVGQFEMDDLKHAIRESRLEQAMLEGSDALSQRVLGVLFKRGDMRRGSDIIDAFCDDARCAGWLMERGWDFIDAGELGLVAKLLDRCSEQAYGQSYDIQAMHAWLAGLSGDRREACHISQRVLAAAPAEPLLRAARIAARVALARFDADSMTRTDYPDLASEGAPEDAIDFLAVVLDDCTSVEVARTFALPDPETDLRLEKLRRAPGKVRSRRLVALFTQCAERFGDSRAYRVALHVLAHVDGVELRHLVQEIGCDEVLRMRRCGVSSFTEASLARDMWDTGYFGLVGPVVDRRDAKVLDGAAHMLEKLARSCGCGAPRIPWEAHGLQAGHVAQKHTANAISAGVEEMYVRMFGGFEITVGDRYLGEGKWRKKARALFGMLVLNNGRDVPRDEIFAQLWPGMSHANALDNFYTVWGNCASIVGETPYIERNGEYCRVDPRFVHSDVAEFEQLARHLLIADQESNYLLDTYAKMEVLYRGSLMPTEKNIRAINAQRERYRAMYIDAMIAATRCALQSNDSRVALWFARKAMEEDQSREDVYRTLMKAQIAAGQRCTAIKTYHVCREYMQGAYGLDPSLETRELYSSLITNDPELLRLESSLRTQPALRTGRSS